MLALDSKDAALRALEVLRKRFGRGVGLAAAQLLRCTPARRDDAVKHGVFGLAGTSPPDPTCKNLPRFPSNPQSFPTSNRLDIGNHSICIANLAVTRLTPLLETPPAQRCPEPGGPVWSSALAPNCWS